MRMKGYPYRILLANLGLIVLLLAFSGCKDEPADPEPQPFVRLLENQVLQSTLLDRTIEYAVLLPEGYDESDESYPVVYLLHGYGEDETAWYINGRIQAYVDGYIAETGPMIYVMPQGFNKYYIDKYNGNYPYMQMFVDELVPTIDALFRTNDDKTQRAVMGYSMGGYGALILPAMNPDVFTISVPLSMSFRTDEQYVAESQGSFDNQWAPNFGPHQGASGTNRLSDYFIERSPFHFFDQVDVSAYSELKILIDCGDDEESLSHTNDNLHTLMRDRGVAHEYRVRSGGHSFDYWKKSYKEALMFISHAAHGIEHPSEPTPVEIDPLLTESDFESVEVSGQTIHILKPTDYETSAAEYPVLYFIHDYGTDSRTVNLIYVFSLLQNAMASGKLPKSIIVEIDESSVALNSDLIEDIVLEVDADYRTLEERGTRVIMGNASGGTQATAIGSEHSELFGLCFLFNAQLPDVAMDTSPDVFYYLDVTDDASSYKGYHALYMKIRDEELDYEYRVRQGGESYQSFLNGLDGSLPELKERLN